MNSATESPTRTTSIPASSAARDIAPAKPRRGLVKPFLIGLVGVAALAWAVHFGLHAYHYVETDNAYITGHLHQVSAQIDAQVKEVLVEDNQNVKAGDVLVRL